MGINKTRKNAGNKLGHLPHQAWIKAIIEKNISPFLLAVILISSGVLFIFNGVNWGLPFRLHPDEGFYINPAINFVRDRTMGPFHHHGFLWVQIFAFAYRAFLFVIGVSPENINDVGIDTFHLIARIITGLFLVGSTTVAYLIGKKYSKATAVVCAFLIAFYPRFITHSHYAVPDIPSVFFMILFILIALNYSEKPGIGNLAGMAIITGLFIVIKYPGAILCATIAVSVVVHSIMDKEYFRIVKHGIMSVLLVVSTVLLLFPWALIRFDAVRASYENEARSTHLGADRLSWGGNMMFYAHNYLIASGLILFVFFIIGCYFIIKDKQVFFKSFPLFYSLVFWIALSYMGLHWERWGLPMYITPLLISAIGITKGFEFIKSHHFFASRRKIYSGAFVSFAFIVAINFISGSAADLMQFVLPDTRVFAQEFNREHGITRENSIFEGYTTHQPGGPANFFGAFERVDDAFYLRERHARYVLMSSSMFNRWRAEPDRFSDQVAIYEHIEKTMTESGRFSDVPRNRSVVSLLNICHSISYVFRTIDNGVVGPTLIFYETNIDSFAPLIFPIVYVLNDQESPPTDNFSSDINAIEDDSAFISNGEAGFLLFGPYTTLEAFSADYTASFELRLIEYIDGNLGFVDVSINNGSTQIARTNLTPEMFTNTLGGHEIKVDFTLPEWSNRIEYRVNVTEGTIMEAVSITIYRN